MGSQSLRTDSTFEGQSSTGCARHNAVDFARLQSMVERYVTNGIFTSAEEQEWLIFLEEEKRTASAYEDIEEKVYDENYSECKWCF